MALDTPSSAGGDATPKSLTTDIGDLSKGGDRKAGPVRHVVLDTAAFVGKRPHFDNISVDETRFWTTESVLREVRDKDSKLVLESFPYKIQTRSVSKEAMTAVSKFARLTGDLHALSRTDTEVIALTWMLEMETHGLDRIKTEPERATLGNKRSMTFSLPGNDRRKKTPTSSSTNPDAAKDATTPPGTTSSSSSESPSTSDASSSSPAAPTASSQSAPSRPAPATTSIPVATASATSSATSSATAPAATTVSSATRTVTAPAAATAAAAAAAAPSPWSRSALSPAPAALSFADRLKLANSQPAAPQPSKPLKVTFPVRFGGSSSQSKSSGLTEVASTTAVSSSATDASPTVTPQMSADDMAVDTAPEVQGAPEASLSDSTNIAEAKSPAVDEDTTTSSEESATSKPKKKVWHPMDSEEWITPENVQEKLGGMGVDTTAAASEAEKMSTVAVLTADYGMQNVILQMGLRLLSINGLSIRSLLQWYKKCAACFRTTRVMEQIYCDWCGGATLYRVSVQIDPAGNVSIRENKRPLANKRGTVYSIPKKKGGRKNADLVLRADSLANVRTQQQQRRNASSGDVFDDAVEFAMESDKSRRSNAFGKFGLTADGRPQFGYGFRKNPNVVNQRSGKKSRRKKRR